MANPVGGIVYVKANGRMYPAKGNFTYNLGIPMREAVVGADSVHGYKEMPQVPFVEGEITDRNDIDLAELCGGDDLTITLELANGKVITLRNAWFAGEGTGNSEEGNIAVRWEGLSADEVK